jgi:hypothetical protein
MINTATGATKAQPSKYGCALSGRLTQSATAQPLPKECVAMVAPLARILPTPLRSQLRSAAAALPLRARSTTREAIRT